MCCGMIMDGPPTAETWVRGLTLFCFGRADRNFVRLTCLAKEILVAYPKLELLFDVSRTVFAGPYQWLKRAWVGDPPQKMKTFGHTAMLSIFFCRNLSCIDFYFAGAPHTG